MPKLSYDKVTSKTVAGEKTNYGIMYGDEKIVFIKVGAGGSIRGYQDKYLQMSHRVHERLGATVICASNPWIGDEIKAVTDKEIIENVAEQLQFSSWELYLVGASDGAYANLVLTQIVPQTVRLLGINTSFKLHDGKGDLIDLQSKLSTLQHVNKTFVYGTKDLEFALVPELQALACENLEIITVEGADHEFSGMVEEFIALIDLI